MFAKFFKAQVEVEPFAVQRAFADKEIALRYLRRETVEPASIARVSDLFFAKADAVAVGMGLGLMLGGEGGDLILRCVSYGSTVISAPSCSLRRSSSGGGSVVHVAPTKRIHCAWSDETS